MERAVPCTRSAEAKAALSHYFFLRLERKGGGEGDLAAKEPNKFSDGYQVGKKCASKEGVWVWEGHPRHPVI